MVEESFLDTFEGLLRRLDKDDVDMVACIARQVWLRRNKWVFQGEFATPTHILQCASNQLESAKSNGEAVRQVGQRRSPQDRERWKKPSREFLKCNWDAAIDSDEMRMGVGVVIKNHEGEVVAAKCCTKPHITDPLVAEIVAAWSAAQFIRHLEIDHVLVEGDSLGVIQSLGGVDRSWAPAGHLVDDAKALLNNCRCWKAMHVRREANAAADCLAKMALQLIEEHQWRNSTPLCIREIVMSEKILIE
jgi:ribonuclease HI